MAEEMMGAAAATPSPRMTSSNREHPVGLGEIGVNNHRPTEERYLKPGLVDGVLQWWLRTEGVQVSAHHGGRTPQDLVGGEGNAAEAMARVRLLATWVVLRSVPIGE